MLPKWIELVTNPERDFLTTVGEQFVLYVQVIPCLVLAGFALIPRLTELATATGSFIVLSFGVCLALAYVGWGIPDLAGIPSFVAGTMLVVALAIGRWPIVDRTS